MNAYLQGLGLGASLIMAIGAQNAHVLRTGLQRRYVGVTVATCVLVDVLLICAGVAGMGAAVEAAPLAMQLIRWGGAAFLLWYGLRSWRAAFSTPGLTAKSAAVQGGLRAALWSVLALSLLNPHVYLDTVILLGGVGGKLPEAERHAFTLGAVTASVVWFSAVGFGAHKLGPWLDRPAVWRYIDLLTGCTMLWLAATLALGG